MLSELGLIFDYHEQTITWERSTIAMKMWNAHLTPEQAELQLKQHVNTMQEMYATNADQESTSRVTRILDAHYKKAELPKIIEGCTNFTSKQQNQLLQLLHKFEPLFDGTLGNWTHSDVKLEV